ncbi:MAG: hypothetical protein AB7O21_19585 [Gammaproteobacteria bacterium]
MGVRKPDKRPRETIVIEQTPTGWRKVRARVPARSASEGVPRPPLRPVPRTRAEAHLVAALRDVVQFTSVLAERLDAVAELLGNAKRRRKR